MDANASGTQTSQLTGSGITAFVSATAEGVSQGSVARGYATGNADFYLTFQVNRFARYTVAGAAQADSNASSGGYDFGGSTALVHIASLTNGVPVLSIDIGHTNSDSAQRRGWVNPGPYTLRGDVSVLVDAKNYLRGTASASWTMDFQLFCPSDYDVNGTVDSTDRTTFLLAYGAGC